MKVNKHSHSSGWQWNKKGKNYTQLDELKKIKYNKYKNNMK